MLIQNWGNGGLMTVHTMVPRTDEDDYEGQRGKLGLIVSNF